MSFHLQVDPHDPIIARDGRPFGATTGARMKTLEWLYPSVLAGSVRTLAGKMAGLDFEDNETIRLLNRLEVHGPVASRGGQLFVPPPKDFVRHPDKSQYYAARPRDFDSGESWDLAEPGLLPALLPDDLDADFKPAKAPAFWSMRAATAWLTKMDDVEFTLGDSDAIQKLEKHERTHVAIEAGTGAAEEGMLFTTEGIEFPEHVSMSARVVARDALDRHMKDWNRLHSIGGERRLAGFVAASPDAWSCPAEALSALSGSTRIRMQLVTPAIFSHGWRPQWIMDPQQTGVELKLISVATDRWRPISGWSYAHPRGAKPIRRMVPAGTVYFFKTDKPPSLLPRFWLAPVSDGDQDRRDGFGLAIWGIW